MFSTNGITKKELVIHKLLTKLNAFYWYSNIKPFLVRFSVSIEREICGN